MKKKNNQLSLELQILIESIRVVLLNEPHQHFIDLIKLPEVDWDRLKKMVIYHRIRPVFYEACRRVGFRNNLTDELTYFVKLTTIKYLVNCRELSKILLIFKENNIEVLPYKGILFSEKIYQNKNIRESADIDLLARPQESKKAIEILLNQGYSIDPIHGDLGVIDDNFWTELIQTSNWREISLSKKDETGITITVDFHWDINEKSHSYNTEIESFFKETEISSFLGKQLLIPNMQLIFKMMLNHHGGRGCLIRLKDFCDFLAYEKHSGKEKSDMFTFAKEIKMAHIWSVAENLMQQFFENGKTPNNNDEKIKAAIIKYWETSDYGTTLLKIRYHQIYRQIQDEYLGWPTYIKRLMKYYSNSDKIERQRIINFPEKYIYLNVASKFITYLWHRILLKFSKTPH